MQQRVHFLDGLRGWAALVVMLIHIFFDILPPIDIAPLQLPLWWPFSGKFAVAIFFLVSGYALSVGFLHSGDRADVIRIGAGRYFRLAIPVFATCAMVSVFLNLGLILAPEDRPPRFLASFGFDPTLTHLLRFSLADVFFDYSPYESYAGPLWTMSFELIGSGIVVALLLLAGRPREAWPIYLAVAIPLIALGSLYALFVIGIMIAEARSWLDRSAPQWIGWLCLLAGARIPLQFQGSWVALIIGSSIFFFGTMHAAQANSFLSNRFSRWIGKLSFPLYLVHAPMIFVVGMPLYMSAPQQPIYLFGAGLVTVGASFACAAVFLPIDKLSTLVSRFVGRSLVMAIRQPRPQS